MMLDIFCAACGAKLLEYQKDGKGDLKRCYLNRIFSPPELECLQHDVGIHQPKHLPRLTCKTCGAVIGTPMRYDDGRLAFRLRTGGFFKKRKPLQNEDDNQEEDKQNDHHTSE